MFTILKKIFGIGPKVDYKKLVNEGAIILDVRTKSEYAVGHIKGSINISVDSLGNNLGALKKKDTTIITCCASGMRSSAAKSFLLSKGYTRVYNGGSWYGLQQKINK